MVELPTISMLRASKDGIALYNEMHDMMADTDIARRQVRRVKVRPLHLSILTLQMIFYLFIIVHTSNNSDIDRAANTHITIGHFINISDVLIIIPDRNIYINIHRYLCNVLIEELPMVQFLL